MSKRSSEDFKSVIRGRMPEGMRAKFGGGQVEVRCLSCWVPSRRGPLRWSFRGDAVEALAAATNHRHEAGSLHRAKQESLRLAQETGGSYFRSYRN